MVLAIIFLVLFAVCAGISIYFSVSMVKSPMIEIDFKKLLIKIGLFVVGAVISFVVASFGFYMWLNAHPDVIHVFQLALGSVLFSGALLIAVNCFILHYYGKNIPKLLDKLLFCFQLTGFVIAVFAFFIYTNGLAPYLTYPLANGISFTQGLVNPNTGTPNIAFYAICILSGAIIVYFICDHYMYKEYGEHGILESTFFVAFPAGIISARIAYVVGNWNQEFANKEFWHVFAIWEGGLTILGGAIGGIIVGAAWYMWRNKGKSIWVPFDIVLPAILVAQAVGRWGNFFNCEVHGLESSIENWKWLPEIVWRNGQYSSTSGYAGDGQMYVPLFFIEAVVNLLGYFVLAHVFGKALRKYTEFGDVGFGYIIWYGATRVLMEPLRSTDYQMGKNGYWSWVWSMIFVVAGTLVIVGNHLIRYISRKKNGTFFVKKHDFLRGIVSIPVIAFSASLLITLGSFMMANNQFKAVVAYNKFNVGLMLLIVGISVLLCLIIAIPILVEALKQKQESPHE